MMRRSQLREETAMRRMRQIIRYRCSRRRMTTSRTRMMTRMKRAMTMKTSMKRMEGS